PIALSQKAFGFADQRTFAALSGDCNPMHMDPVAARRTQAGAPVVHGIHLLLWALNSFADANPQTPPLRRVRVRFVKFVYVDETASVFIGERKAERVKLAVCVGDTQVSQLTLELGEPSAGGGDVDDSVPLLEPPKAPRELAFDAMALAAGRLRFAASPA